MKTDLETLRLGDEERPEPERAGVPALPSKTLVVRREMTADEAAAARCIWTQVTFPVGHWDKRFMRELPEEITEKQAAQVWRIFRTYRRQIKHPRKAELLAMAESLKQKVEDRGEAGGKA